MEIVYTWKNQTSIKIVLLLYGESNSFLSHKYKETNHFSKTKQKECSTAKSITSTNYMFHIHNNEYNNSPRGLSRTRQLSCNTKRFCWKSLQSHKTKAEVQIIINVRVIHTMPFSLRLCL
jgi:hypothetical protein